MKPVKIFLSYSHSDREHKNTLLKHISLMNINNQIEIWDDEMISLGSNWKMEIEKKLKETDIAVLLVSSYFLASDFINNFEIPILLEQNKINKTLIVPILISPVYFHESELSNFQGLPRKGKAITHWQNQDEAWINVVSELDKLIDKKQKGSFEKSSSEKLRINKIKKLIAKNRIKSAIQEINELRINNEEVLNDLMLLEARLKRLDRSSMLGILSFHDELLERNKIVYSLLNILNEL